MKRIVYLVMFILLATMVAPPGVMAAPSFSDINSHWAKDYISAMSASGYINGYPDGSFQPDKVVTKAEFLTVLILCLGVSPTDTSSSYFADTSKHWARGYINEAVKRKILVPTEYPGNLKPDQALKRSEAAAMTVRALGKDPDNSPLTFNDKDALGKSIYRGYIKVASDLGLLVGYPSGNFEPFIELTRAQMSKVTYSFLEELGRAPSMNAANQSTNIDSGTFNSIAIGDEIYQLTTSPLSFKTGLTSIAVTSLGQSQGFLFVNNQYRFALDTPLKDLDVIVNNTRYSVNQIGVNNNRLVIFPGNRKLASVTISAHKYDADFVKLYLNSSNTSHYLADLMVIDEYTVELAGIRYKLNQDKVTIELGGTFYDIKKLSLTANDTVPQLSHTDPVVVSGYTLSNISTIFAGTTILNPSNIKYLDFIIDGRRYRLSEVIIDASGKFTVGDKTYACDQVIMIVDDLQYKIDHISMLQSKLVFYCTVSTGTNLVMINDVYRDFSTVKILKDNIAYELDKVMVVSRNILRVGGKQYNLDSTFKVAFDGKIYNLDQIDYDSRLQTTTITTSANAVTGTQPVKYVFFKDNSLYQEGATDDVTIYASRKWVTFDQILVSDPSHFTMSGASYELIGALIKIKNADFEVVDTAWHGSTQVLDIYLRKI